MFNEISRQLYKYIIDAEMIFLDIYKIDPWTVMNHMTLIDLQIYMNRIKNDWDKKKERLQKKDVMETLKHVNEILTWVFHKK